MASLEGVFMKKIRNVFLTTLCETKNRLDINYYSCETFAGGMSYTTGVSVAEAGVKYILSQQLIDEIIMIGSPSIARDNAMRETTLSDVDIYGVSELDSMNEYDFLNYRVAEYMMQTDIELLDLEEPISKSRKDELKERINRFRTKKANNVPPRELFTVLSTDASLSEEFQRDVMGDTDVRESHWIKYYIYNEMDSFYKMHILEGNKNTKLKYVPVSTEDTLTMDDINRIVRIVLPDAGGNVKLFLDVQGLGTIDGNTLISTSMLMNSRIGYGCNVEGVINSFMAPGRFAGKVTNVLKSYEIQRLISGLDIFLSYGKTDILKEYWQTLGIFDPDADRLFYGMESIDEGICLCNVDLIACGIEVIKKALQHPTGDVQNRSIYLEVIINAITSDYGSLLKGEELSIPELLKWSLRKGLYQQTLTIIESKVPEDIVKRGIYYYARNEEDIKAVMKDFNVLFWNESSKMRWAFGDIEHYFIKSYGRSYLDFHQKPDMVAKDYARLRIDALHGRTEDILCAYSELDNDDLLYELLLGYYRIGNLRNQVNHAIVEEPDMDGDILSPRKDSRTELCIELKKFIGIYNMACNKTIKKNEPVLLPSARMKSYTRRHEIKPLEKDSDSIARGNYTCSFNGKELEIHIAMFDNDEDIEI